MRVVIDANVFVSAAIAQGPSHRIVRAVMLSERHEAIVCPALLQEVADVLGRPRLQKRIGADHAHRYLRDLRIMTTRVRDPIDVGAHTRDRDDDYLVALAREHPASSGGRERRPGATTGIQRPFGVGGGSLTKSTRGLWSADLLAA